MEKSFSANKNGEVLAVLLSSRNIVQLKGVRSTPSQFTFADIAVPSPKFISFFPVIAICLATILEFHFQLSAC